MPEASTRLTYNRKTDNIIGLTKDVRIRLGKILDDDILQELAEKNFTGKEGKRNKQKFIDRLKKVMRDPKQKEIMDKNMIKYLNKERLVNQINEILSTRGRLKISTETEIASARTLHDVFGSSAMTDLIIAGLNGKADSLHIGTIYGDIDIPDNVQKEITDYVSKIYETTYESAYKDTIREL
jgi:hypothetical protein